MNDLAYLDTRRVPRSPTRLGAWTPVHGVDDPILELQRFEFEQRFLRLRKAVRLERDACAGQAAGNDPTSVIPGNFPW